MRRKTRPWYVTALVKPAKKGEASTYGVALCTVAICENCDHASVVANARPGVDDAALRPKLKCSRCGARAPRRETYRRDVE